MTSDLSEIRALLDRLSRLSAADDWQDGLNPSQFAALGYLARANRFSRSPSHVAAYLGATRGTVSQSLKSLLSKGFVGERRSPDDRRSLSFDLTGRGRAALGRRRVLDDALSGLSRERRADLGAALSEVLRGVLQRRGGKGFGLCRTCAYHRHGPEGRYCTLLNLALSEEDAGQICHEHLAPDPAPA
ncbi:MAG: MarR family transcriptional regulator [Rhodobacteraceae bacterium]|nr:MarR family transcriptional regulator [Paracoccaceae bacterium]